MDKPVLTPRMVLSLRGIDPEEWDFDTALLCFRGAEGCELLSTAFDAEARKGLYLYGSEPWVARGVNGQLVIVPSVLWGGPVTAILLEELAVLGVTTVIGFGAAGSLVSVAHVGGLLIAEAALCRDGASREYTDAQEAYPDPELLQLAVGLSRAEGVTPVLGTVHTTDALYRETPARLAQWQGWGAEFVNLETGPFYAVASSLGMRAVYLALVTDYVAGDRNWDHGYWGRDNPTDPVIVKVIRRLVDHVQERGSL